MRKIYLKPRLKILIAVVVFVGVAIGAASLFKTRAPSGEGLRTPSSVRLPARYEDVVFTPVPGGADTRAMAREATARTGLRALRARRVVFHSESLRAAKRGDRLVRLHLFDDAIFTVRFREPSPLVSLRGELVGQVEGDPKSRVHLWATTEKLSGELVTAGRTYRITYAGKNQHYIVEIEAAP